MQQATLKLESCWNYNDWLAATANHFRFKSLVWNGQSPTPHWLPAAQGDHSFGKTTSNSEDSDEPPVTRKKTSKATSSTDDSTIVQQALAQALMVLTK